MQYTLDEIPKICYLRFVDDHRKQSLSPYDQIRAGEDRVIVTFFHQREIESFKITNAFSELSLKATQS